MRVVVLTGAGISAESGVPTFRDAGGLWEGYRVEEVATPEAYAARPDIVHAFYDARRAALHDVAPNPAHAALAELEAALGDDLLVVTQNVDDLHERAGSTRVLHMHGELRRARCTRCSERNPWLGPLAPQAHPAGAPACPACQAAGTLRPDVVWFGEVPFGLEEIDGALERGDVFCAIGTSGWVYPAAGFVLAARSYGAHTVQLNLEVAVGESHFDEHRHGPATTLVPTWVSELLAGLAAVPHPGE